MTNIDKETGEILDEPKKKESADLERMKRLVTINAELKELSEQEKKLKEEREKIEPLILDYFAEEGIEKITVTGMTLFPVKEIWASLTKGNKEGLKILREHGLEDYIYETVNSQSISAFVREFERNEEEIPDWVHKALNVSEKFRVRVRKR